MKIIRFAYKNVLNSTFYGRLDGKKIFKLLNSPFDETLKFDEESLDFHDVKI